jgi:hypothetical protein
VDDDELLEPFEGAHYARGPLYDFPEWYEVDYARYLAEERFYRFAIERAVGDGAYVELGAGTGRLLLRFAADGVRCHAVEPSGPMLDWLHGEAARRGLRVTSENRAAEHAEGPGGAVDLVAFPFNGLLHIHTHEALGEVFGRARGMLSTGGALAVDITCPSWEAMSMARVAWGRVDERTHPVDGTRILTCDRTSYDAARRVLKTDYRFVPEDERRGYELYIEQRMWTFPELAHALWRAGFEIESAFGDVDLRPFKAGSPRMLVIAR